MSLNIALAGNPNCGKTTFFNTLTSSAEYTGNRAGVTVEAKSARLKDNSAKIIDLPGIYSMSPYTPEEIVARKVLSENKISAIINVVDASNLERNLYLTLQLIETGKPVVTALNMIDLTKDKIDTKRLSSILGCEVIETSALHGNGIQETVSSAIKASNLKAPANFITYSPNIESTLRKIESIAKPFLPKGMERFYTIKIFERDENSLRTLKLDKNTLLKIENIIHECEQKENDDSESLIISQKYAFIESIINECVIKSKHSANSYSDKIDRLITNKWLFLPITLICFAIIYFFAISLAGKLFGEFLNDIIFGSMLNGLAENMTDGFFKLLFQNGIINGVGTVVSFLPQLTALFLCLSLLEECGYMARIAFNFDCLFRKFGLSGKSVIPFLLATGCGVSGIMSSRTIENRKSRRLTIMTATFMPCSAKLPVIALISAQCFGGSWLLALASYLFGILAIIVSGIILKQIPNLNGSNSPFVMELPSYHVPNIKVILSQTIENVKDFLIKAGTVIFLSSTVVWFMSAYDFGFNQTQAEHSMLAIIGKTISPVFKPLGWSDWQAAVGTVSGLFAKENIVSTFGVLGFSANNLGKTAALSFLIFNLLCAPCIAATAAMIKETGFKSAVFAVVYQTVFAYFIAFYVYNFNWIICLETLLFCVLVSVLKSVRKKSKKSKKIC